MLDVPNFIFDSYEEGSKRKFYNGDMCQEISFVSVWLYCESKRSHDN